MLRPKGQPTVTPALAAQHMLEPFADTLGGSSRAVGTGLDRRLGWMAKRGIDVTVAGAALLLLLPLLLLVGAAVWMGDRKSPIFRHNRLGRGGTPFGCLKFRTMVV
ncbi:sugar transferase, partial [Methylobacterium sp. J-076]|uniref:sugar transferase n=1 Tax=Methylobacterium sp. J-076 TaxID=2836655 RepID=UPI001FB91EBA